jgi:hypothetical protein
VRPDPLAAQSLLNLILLLLTELGLELLVSRPRRHPKVPGTAAKDVHVVGAG